MAGQVRIIAGPRNKSFDHFIQDAVDRGAWGLEHDYFGIEDQDVAEGYRKKLRTAGSHMDPPVSVRAYWKECGGCDNGGPTCRFHVKYTVYNRDEARAYKQRVQESARNPAGNNRSRRRAP